MRFIFSFIFILLISSSFAQRKVEWSFTYDSENEEILMTATIEEGWHMYSIDVNENIGPVATSFSFDKNKAVKLKGEVEQPSPISEYDENFEGDLTYFEESVTFTQKIKFKESTSLKGTVTYMVCDNTMCMPPVDESFVITIEK